MDTFFISGGMTIYETGALKIELLDELMQAKKISVDLSAVSEIDTSGLQLLISLQRNKVTLLNHSLCIKQLAQLLQLHEPIGLETTP